MISTIQEYHANMKTFIELYKSGERNIEDLSDFEFYEAGERLSWEALGITPEEYVQFAEAKDEGEKFFESLMKNKYGITLRSSIKKAQIQNLGKCVESIEEYEKKVDEYFDNFIEDLDKINKAAEEQNKRSKREDEILKKLSLIKDFPKSIDI